jgi:hypothetical protein
VKRIVVAAMTAACFLAAAAPAYAVRDFSGTALNIIPSGQYGAVPVPKKAAQQAKMYDALTPLFDHVTKRDLFRDFKSEKLGTKGQGRMKRERVPHRGVRILRDKFNVPHIFATTNDDVTWGAGWAIAHDRELLLEQARFNARVAVVDAPGLSAIGLVVGLKSFQPSAQTERELHKEIGKIKKYDIVDMYVETLCGGSDTKYLYGGQCRDMTHFNAGEPSTTSRCSTTGRCTAR